MIHKGTGAMLLLTPADKLAQQFPKMPSIMAVKDNCCCYDDYQGNCRIYLELLLREGP